MRIGELSRESGVKIGTIRFYERKGLLKPATRTTSGYRLYNAQDITVLKGIKRAQELGFSLKEVKEFIVLHETAASSVSNKQINVDGVQRAIALTKEKLDQLQNKIRLLRGMQKEIARMLDMLQTTAEKACLGRQAGR